MQRKHSLTFSWKEQKKLPQDHMKEKREREIYLAQSEVAYQMQLYAIKCKKDIHRVILF